MPDFVLYRMGCDLHVSPTLNVLPVGAVMVGFHFGGTTAIVDREAQAYVHDRMGVKFSTLCTPLVVMRRKSGGIRLAVSVEFPILGDAFPVAVIFARDTFGTNVFYAIAETDPALYDGIKAVILRIFADATDDNA